MQPQQSIFDHQPTERLQFKIDQVLNLSFNSICIKGFFCQTLCYFLIIFVMRQEQYILTSFNGYKFVENFVKIFPIMFLVSYEIPEFFEQYFANKKMATYATGESVQDINRQEFATNCIVAILMLAIPAAQPAIFSVLQVDSEYRAMFLLSTVLGIIGPFKSTVYSVFSLKQNYVYIMAGKMVSFSLSSTPSTREKQASTHGRPASLNPWQRQLFMQLCQQFCIKEAFLVQKLVQKRIKLQKQVYYLKGKTGKKQEKIFWLSYNILSFMCLDLLYTYSQYIRLSTQKSNLLNKMLLLIFMSIFSVSNRYHQYQREYIVLL
ncbi:Hypothetical_protein [Hexamita inflata]|uniref:Hypothetical_protein n=1 Tax=Hexamita inflata TaxID=28002 RepID=A0AA86UP32_9EUKA|nr:Hypothetical protein HINF_LOCUS46531 [Hexamita inflata]